MNELNYVRVGDYLLPNLELSDPPDAPPRTDWRLLRIEELRTK